MENNMAKSQAGSVLHSPEQLNDYLKVTTPKIWVLLVAVIILVGGLLLWSNFATIESYASGTASAKAGELTVTFDDATKASKVKPGMEMEVGDVKTAVLTIGTNEKGEIVASAQAKIPDGVYNVRVGYNTAQVISMLFN